VQAAPDPDRLSDDDARILSLESSSVTGHTLKLNVLAPGPRLDLEALRSAVADRLPREP
jgi:diacylglycerol O-acyltransferase